MRVVTETVETPQMPLVEKILKKVMGLITELISQLQKEALEDDIAKHSSTLETPVSRSTEADPESVNEGHPDKICDQFSDVVLDACLTCDARCKVACETCVKDNMFMVAGEITVARKCHQNIEIDSSVDDSSRVDSKRLHFQDLQSPFIAGGVHVDKNDPDDGAGDQGMFEYASNETEDAVSLTHQVATHMRKKSSDVYNNGDPWWFRAHGKTQVTIEHVEGTDESLDPKKIHTFVTHATAAATREQETVTQEKTEERERTGRVKHERRKEGELRKKGTRRSRRT